MKELAFIALAIVGWLMKDKIGKSEDEQTGRPGIGLRCTDGLRSC
jgi:hypothetical protein